MAYLGNSPITAQQEYKNIDDISGSFNGSTTSFALLVGGIAPVPAPTASNQVLISVAGVVQRPDDTGTEGFRLSGGNIVFSSAPASGADFFGVILAGADYMNAGGTFPDGTTGAPSITFTDDTDTGFFRSGSGTVKFTSNAVDTATFGSTSLTAPSFIPTSSTVPSNGVYLPSANNVAIATNTTNRVQIDSSGRVGIGTTSPRLRTHIRGDSANAPTLGVASGSLIVGPNDNDYGMMFGVSGSGWGWIQAQNFVTPGGAAYDLALQPSGGRVLVGTSSSRTVGNTPGSIQIEGVTDTSLTITDNSNGSAGDSTWLTLARTRGTTVGGTTAVSNGDWLGNLDFAGHNGSTFNVAARISGQVDGAVSGGGVGDMPGRLVFSTTADGASSPTERMRINNSGQILIGKASDTLSTAGWAIDGGSTIGRGQLTCGSSGAPILRLNHTGGAATEYVVESWKNGTQVGSISVTASATAYNTSSDYRLKENVIPLTGAIDRLQQIPVHRFNFIADPDKTVDGFIAHEAQEIVPECVTGEKDAVDDDGNPVYQGIDQSKLVPLLTAALQEAIGRIETLEAEVTALKTQ